MSDKQKQICVMGLFLFVVTIIPKMKLDMDEINIRILKIILNYELYGADEPDSIKIMVESFRRFIYRNDHLAENSQSKFIHFCKFFIHFLEIPAFKKGGLTRLYTEVIDEPSISEREWLENIIKQKAEC